MRALCLFGIVHKCLMSLWAPPIHPSIPPSLHPSLSLSLFLPLCPCVSLPDFLSPSPVPASFSLPLTYSAWYLGISISHTREGKCVTSWWAPILPPTFPSLSPSLSPSLPPPPSFPHVLPAPCPYLHASRRPCLPSISLPLYLLPTNVSPSHDVRGICIISIVMVGGISENE